MSLATTLLQIIVILGRGSKFESRMTNSEFVLRTSNFEPQTPGLVQ